MGLWCASLPFVTVPRVSQASPVTLIVPYYDNPVFFARQLVGWASYPAELAQHLSIIVVDDGSPEHPAESVPRPPLRSFRLFRIQRDVRWNWLAARNIGFHHADDGWCIVTDIDHMVPADTLAACVYGLHHPGAVYAFSRREHTGAEVHPHSASFFMTRETFWKIGGYDETLSGHYGTDGEFRRRVAAVAKMAVMTEPLIRYEYVDDSSTTRYLRKQPQDAAVKKLVAARKPGWHPKVLSFEYAEVAC